MSYTQNNVPLLHRKEWQMMTPAFIASAAGSFVITDATGSGRYAMYIVSATQHYFYDHYEDAWDTIPASGIAGVFGAGSCGVHHSDGGSYTATGGTTTTINTNLSLFGAIIGKKVRITAGTNAGEERTIIDVTPGATSIITVDTPFSNPIDNTSVYNLLTGRFWFFNAGTSAVGLRYYDLATMAWSGALSVAGLPTAWGTDGKLVSTPSTRTGDQPMATGTATSGSTTTLVNSAKTWTTNQWTNYQVRITAGTGVGKVATITSNNATILNFANIGATLDNTSEYVIEGNDDFLYLLGNGAVTMYRYSKSANTWATISPTVARGAIPGAGMSANWIARVNNSSWTNESNIQNGRFIYSFRGSATNTLHRYDVALNRWETVVYGGAADTFSTGSSYDQSGNFYYIRQNATNRFFKYDFDNNFITGLTTNLYTDSTAVVGDKIWTKSLDGSNVEWLYSIGNTLTVLHRIMLY
jgi:hypothetical protein